MMRASLFLLFLSISVPVVADPQLGLLDGKNLRGPCRAANTSGFQKIQTEYTFSPNELIITITAFSDNACKQMLEINRYKLMCKFTANNEYAQCKHTARASSKDGINWDSLPVESLPGMPVSGIVLARVLSVKGRLQMTTIHGNEKPFIENLAK